jgi:hypothetical protein
MMGYQLALNSVANQGSVFRLMLPAYTQRDAASADGSSVVLNSAMMGLR